jgi:hypothetical protein
MIIYRVMYHDKDEGCCYEWFSSKLVAMKRLRQIQRERGSGGGVPAGPEYVETLELPTTKRALLSWLNAYFTRDNG